VVLLLTNESGLGADYNQGWIGQLLIITASLANALAVIYIRIRVRDENTTVLAAGEVFGSLLVILPLALVSEGIPTFVSVPWQAWATLVIGAVTAQVAGAWLLFHIVNKYSASMGGFSSIATPLFTAAIGIMLLGEILTLPILVGTVLLLAGIWSLNYF
jgi:drug/metabolite transporter (DMT)-like permease